MKMGSEVAWEGVSIKFVVQGKWETVSGTPMMLVHFRLGEKQLPPPPLHRLYISVLLQTLLLMRVPCQ